MGFLYWFPPYSSDKWEIIEPASDQAFETELYSRTMLLLRGSKHVELLCDNASRPTSTAFNAFLNGSLEKLCGRVVAIRFRQFTAANAETLKPLVERLPELRSLELLKGFTLDRASVDVLSGLPNLEELAVDTFEFSKTSSRWPVIDILPKLKTLKRLAVPRCFLLEPEIDALIETCNLVELAVANAYDEDGQKAIQEKYEYCKIDWGLML